MNWKYIKPLKSFDYISEFENKFNYVFPDDFKNCIKLYNGGRPADKVFDTIAEKEREIKALLSFNHDDRETIWLVNQRNDEFTSKYVAFAIDSAGDLICFDKTDNSVVFIDHETNTVEFVSDSFIKFLQNLYSL